MSAPRRAASQRAARAASAPGSSAPGAAASPRRPPPIPALTGLRFVAALWVIIHHYGQFVRYPGVLRWYADHGPISVCMFFVLSGFVLAYNYVDWFAADLCRWRAFVWARATRILPMYFFALAIATPVALSMIHAPPIYGGTNDARLGVSWLSNLALVQAFVPRYLFDIWNTPGWSLSAEASFYLAFPLFMRYALARRQGWASLLRLGLVVYAVQIAAFAAATVVLRRTNDPAQYGFLMTYFTYFSPLLRVWEFFLGCVLGVFVLRKLVGVGRSTPRVFGSGRVPLALVAVSVATMHGLFFLVAWRFAGSVAVQSAQWYVLGTPLVLLLILGLASGPSLVARLLASPWLVRLGEASYSLYIIHWIPLVVLKHRAMTGRPIALGHVLLAVAATVAASLWCEHYVEIPVRRWLLGRERRSRPVARRPVAE